MSETSVQRRLAAILAADVVGYSKMMGENEVGTLAAVRRLRAEVIEPKVAEHQGRLFKSMGDGFLVEFPSVVNAVACAVAVQKTLDIRNADSSEDPVIQLRIGVNLGDVIVEGDDLFGDGVNVAARLESTAPPGGISISGIVRDSIGARLSVDFENRREQRFKNIAAPVRVLTWPSTTGGAVDRPDLRSTDRPSIAVLPFANLSGDPEQDYFASGVVEEIITALTRKKWLTVINHNLSLKFKDRSSDLRQIGSELGARYILEGSIRKSTTKLRITAQLIDSDSLSYIWNERLEGPLSDVFELQDQITTKVVGAIAPSLQQAEIILSLRKPTEKLDAYDCFLRGMAAYHRWDNASSEEALEYFNRAILHDSKYAPAYGMAARCYVQRKSLFLFTGSKDELSEVERLARAAATLGKDDAVALWTSGFALAFVVGDLVTGDRLIDRSLSLDPSNSIAWAASGWVQIYRGDHEEGLKRETHALTIAAQDENRFSKLGASSLAHFLAGRYSDSLANAEAAIEDQPNAIWAMVIAAVAAASLGQIGRALEFVDEFRKKVPQFDLGRWKTYYPLASSDHRTAWIEGLHRIGLAELE